MDDGGEKDVIDLVVIVCAFLAAVVVFSLAVLYDLVF